MKLAVVSNTNGNFAIHTEHGDNETAAIMEFHAYSRALWGDSGTTKATVEILDDQLDLYKGYKEVINKEEPEPNV